MTILSRQVEGRRSISDQISAIRKQEKAYTEIAEGTEFAERNDRRKKGGGA